GSVCRYLFSASVILAFRSPPAASRFPYTTLFRSRLVPQVAVLGVVGAAMIQWLYFVAIDRVPVGVAILVEFTGPVLVALWARLVDRKSTRLNSSHVKISYAVFCLKKKKSGNDTFS